MKPSSHKLYNSESYEQPQCYYPNSADGEAWKDWQQRFSKAGTSTAELLSPWSSNNSAKLLGISNCNSNTKILSKHWNNRCFLQDPLKSVFDGTGQLAQTPPDSIDEVLPIHLQSGWHPEARSSESTAPQKRLADQSYWCLTLFPVGNPIWNKKKNYFSIGPF